MPEMIPLIPTKTELISTLEVLDCLDKSKLLTEDEKTALAVVSDAIVALTDPLDLVEYQNLDKRLKLRVKVWHE
jgi:hypothetical protein